MFTENNFAYLGKTGHVRLADLMGIEFVNAIMIMELDAESDFFRFCHQDLFIRVS
jgi:hypothetical protein